jgi:hypothetical protein
MKEKWWHKSVLILLASIPIVGFKIAIQQAEKWKDTIPLGEQ